jgi:hypothetical protein
MPFGTPMFLGGRVGVIFEKWKRDEPKIGGGKENVKL